MPRRLTSTTGPGPGAPNALIGESTRALTRTGTTPRRVSGNNVLYRAGSRPVPLGSAAVPEARDPLAVPEWNETGYDLVRQDRYVYTFLTGSCAEVKVGMAGVKGRLGARLREVAKKWNDPEIRMVGSAVVPDVDSQTVESIEAVIRHWLVLAAGFEHSVKSTGSACRLRRPMIGRRSWLRLSSSPLTAQYGFGGHHQGLASEIWPARNPRPTSAAYSDDGPHG